MIGWESLKGWRRPVKASRTNKIEVCIDDKINIFFSNKAAYIIFKILSTDKSLNKQYIAFMETLFYNYFLGKYVVTPHHLNYNVCDFYDIEGIYFNGSIEIFLYFFNKILEKFLK